MAAFPQFSDARFLQTESALNATFVGFFSFFFFPSQSAVIKSMMCLTPNGTLK